MASSHARVTSIKSTKQHWAGQWVTNNDSQWLDSGPNSIAEKETALIITERETWKFYLNRREHPNDHKCKHKSLRPCLFNNCRRNEICKDWEKIIDLYDIERGNGTMTMRIELFTRPSSTFSPALRSPAFHIIATTNIAKLHYLHAYKAGTGQSACKS